MSNLDNTLRVRQELRTLERRLDSLDSERARYSVDTDVRTGQRVAYLQFLELEDRFGSIVGAAKNALLDMIELQLTAQAVAGEPLDYRRAVMAALHDHRHANLDNVIEVRRALLPEAYRRLAAEYGEAALKGDET